MAHKLAKHGSNAGYRAEQNSGNVCDRCRKAHNVYNKQFTKSGKAAGLKYTNYQVIDHLYSPSPVPSGLRRPERSRAQAVTEPSAPTLGPPESQPEPHMPTQAEPSQAERGPSVGDRLTAGLRNLVMPDGESYVNDEEPPEYLHTVNPDPEPDDSEWSEVTDDEFVLNAAGMREIEQNLGTYLSVVGMTVEMIDPYCGPILAENFDNIVNRWSKVVAHYPGAAKLFLDKKGGTIFAWIGALQATWPVLYAVYEHHLSRTVRTKDGRVMRVYQNGQGPTPDGVTPQFPDEYQYSTN